MITIKNRGLEITVRKKDGLICGLYSGLGAYNLADLNGMGGICYTQKGDDIRTERPFTPYKERFASYDSVIMEKNRVRCRNEKLSVETIYSLKHDLLTIESHTDNPEISQFGIDLNLNFLSKKNGTYVGQLLPSSPYTSRDGDKMYCIMPVIACGFCIVMAKGECRAWRIHYSEYSYGHFIQRFQMLSALDERYGTGGSGTVTLEIAFADTIAECYRKIQESYGCPMLYSEITGTFGRYIDVKLLGEADYVTVLYEERERELPVTGDTVRAAFPGYGLCRVVPYKDGRPGLDLVLWFGEDMDRLFEKSCETVRKPYHNDVNLCEGMTWCWALLSYMATHNSDRYRSKVEEAIRIVMGEGERPIPGNTIVPYPVDGFPAYHVYQSRRIQEQFFGISILTEQYKMTGEKRYLDFAVRSAETMIESYQQENGAFVQHSDYTTVCAPVIAIIDLARQLRNVDQGRVKYFSESAARAVRYLMERGLHFPTEGIVSGQNDEEMEEGSISCTALSLLYYCRYIEYVEEYVIFAEKVLRLHDWWRCYTPDVRLYMSTMRWWETIWEGDGTGPGICAGHAWSIWRAEADFHMGVLTGKGDYFLSSWNGYMTNFSKITKEGESYSCYQPDYFVGGGDPAIRRTLMQLSDEDIEKRYEITHGYPKHYDHSLSRYVWVRACPTWRKAAVVIFREEGMITLNCEFKNNKLIVPKAVEEIYFC